MHKRTNLRRWLACGAAAGVLAMAVPALAEQAPTYAFDVAAQPMTEAVQDVGRQAGVNILVDPSLVAGRRAPAVRGEMTMEVALAQILAGTDLQVQRTAANSLLIRRAAQDPQGGSAGGDVDALIVTAQKREENIQDVPIAISAFSQEDLTRSQVAGGPDLMTQIPNFTFTKTNFTGYSIQIRGIGTQAISATTDAAVAVAFNNTPFIRNRFFEQEFFDVARVEVLRGPQGTLYGRNATAGVVNLISAKPTYHLDAKGSVDLGNYESRRFEGMLNIPLTEDTLALRLAGAWTQREGYSTNQITGDPIDGRDLWSIRATLAFEPTDRLSAFLLYEHFDENDDRLRSGKQVCKKDPGPSEIGGVPVRGEGGAFGVRSYTSQGCLPASMYAAESFQTPNGFALPFYGPTKNLGGAVFGDVDPYASTTQSRDLRVIESMVDPQYRARTDVAQFQVSFDLDSSLTLASETAYSTDSLFSLQDYNRFNTKPGAFDRNNAVRPGVVDANGVFCDPQLGCSDRLLLVDLSTAESRHFSQEFRLSSDFEGPFNFSLGANFLRYDTEDKYYVFINSLSMFAAQAWGHLNTPYVAGVTDNSECQNAPERVSDPRKTYSITRCIYLDTNPIGSLNDQGRNYFLSKNPYRLISYAGFGEMYYNITPTLKLTGGFRWTVDKKHAPQVPSWLLASDAIGEYPVMKNIDLNWSEPTGRLAIDWQPDLGFTEQTLLYASYAHGYKAGGSNPPPPVIASYGSFADEVIQALQTHPESFEAEYIDAFEVGAKNTFLDGRVTFNLGAFYYDYEGYQISQIIDRSAVNLNFDAEVWGAEIEADWRPTDNLRLGFKGGYQNTRMADGSGAVDTMDRTAGTPGWVVIKPFPTIPSNCILPTSVVAAGGILNITPSVGNVSFNGICSDAYYRGLDPLTGAPYILNPTIDKDGDPLPPELDDYPGFDPTTAPNNGTGFTKDLSGNELPNAPHFTATVTADYSVPLRGDWIVTLHSDFYYQSEAWTRVFNTEGYDKLKAYTNLNLAAIFNNEVSGLTVMAYIKNVFDRDSITGAFLNSDDTGLTTNVFLTEPRLYGIRLTKQWDGASLLGGLLEGREHTPGRPYLFQVELGGSISQFQADDEVFAPGFVSAYQPSLQFPLDVQDSDLDRGDQRQIKLTYAPAGWRVSAAYLYGRTSGHGRVAAYEQVPGGIVTSPLFPPTYQEGPDNYGISSFRGSEEHTVADFTIGKEVGIGLWGESGKSFIGAGVRYAQLKSASSVNMVGTPDWYIPATDESKYPSQHHSEYTASVGSDRSFEGVGPMLAWEASQLLLGDDTVGRVDLDWSLTGGVLFGKQRTTVEGQRKGLYRHWPQGVATPFPPETVHTLYDVPIAEQRTDNVTLPVVGLSLGLSYALDRVKVSGGYRWERYVDVIDGGIEQSQDYDRTIDGPFLKLSIGFGG